MKVKFYLATILVCLSGLVGAQTFELSAVYLTINSKPQAYSAKLEIGDSFVITTVYGLAGDTTPPVITKERVLRRKGYYVKTATSGGALNYEWALSDDKAEKKENIYIISMLFAGNDGVTRRTMFFKGKMIQ